MNNNNNINNNNNATQFNQTIPSYAPKPDQAKVTQIANVLTMLDSEEDCLAFGANAILEQVTLEDVQIALQTSTKTEHLFTENGYLIASLSTIQPQLDFFKGIKTATPNILRSLNLSHITQIGEGIPLKQSALWFALCSDIDFLNSPINALDIVEENLRKSKKEKNSSKFTEAKAEHDILWRTINQRIAQFNLTNPVHHNIAMTSNQLTIKNILLGTSSDIAKIGRHLTIATCRLLQPAVLAEMDAATFDPNNDDDDDDDERDTRMEKNEVYQYLRNAISTTQTVMQSAVRSDNSNPKLGKKREQTISLTASKILREQTSPPLAYTPGGDQMSFTITAEGMHIDFLPNDYATNPSQFSEPKDSEYFPDAFYESLDITTLTQLDVDHYFHSWKLDGKSDFVRRKENGQAVYKFTWKEIAKPYNIVISAPNIEHLVRIANGEKNVSCDIIDAAFAEAKRRLVLIGDEKYALLMTFFELAPELSQDTLQK